MAEPDPNTAPAAAPEKTRNRGRPGRRRARWWRIAAWTGANLIGLILLILAALVFFTGPAIERLAPPLARQAGVPLDRLGGVDIDPPQIVLSDVVLADGAVTVDRIVADWAGIGPLRDFLTGSALDTAESPALLNGLTIEGLDLSGRIDPAGGFVIPGLTPETPAEGGGGIALPPVAGPIAVEGSVSLETPVGPVAGTIDLSGSMTAADLSLSGPVAATLDITADAPTTPVAGGGSVSLAADLLLGLTADGAVDALLTELTGGGDAGPIMADLTEGWLSVYRPAEGGAAPRLAADLAARLTGVPGPAGSPPPLNLNLSAMGPADPDGLQGRATLTGPGGTVALDRTETGVNAAVTSGDMGVLLATATAWAESLGVPLPLPPLLEPLGGAVELSLDLSTPGGLVALMEDGMAGRVAGGFDLSARDLSGADARIDAVAARGRIEVDDGVRLIGTGAPWRVETIRYGAAPPLSVAVEGMADPQRIALGPGASVEATGGVYLSGPLGVGVAELAAAFEGRSGTVTLRRVETGPVQLGDVVARLSSPEVALSVDPQAVTVAGPVTAALEPGDLGPFAWDAAGASGALRFTLADGAIAVATEGALSLALAGLKGPAGVAAPGPVTLSLTGAAGLDPDGQLLVEADLQPPEEAIDLTSPTLGAMTLTLPNLTASATGPLAGPIEVTTGMEGGRLRASGPGLTLAPLAGEGSLTLNGPETTGSLTLPTVRIDLDAMPDALSPIRVSGGLSLAGDTVAGNGRVRTGPLSVPWALNHSLTQGWGVLRLRETGVTIGPSGTPLGDLVSVEALPALIDPTAVRGEVTLGGVVRWAPSGLTEATASLRLANGALLTEMPEVAGLALAAEIDLLDRRLIGETRITADLLSAKLQAEDVSLTVSQPSATEIRLESLSGTVAGGDLGIEPVTLPLDPLVGTVSLTVTEARLGRLLEIVPLDGLTATAPVSGTIPVQITGAGLRIASAELAATEPGRLVYRPDERPGWADRNGSLTLLFDALEDFRFERLVATLAGDPLADLTVGLDVEGANPAVYGGYPIALGVNVEGPLLEILGRTVNLTLTEEQIRGLLEEGGTTLPEETSP